MKMKTIVLLKTCIVAVLLMAYSGSMSAQQVKQLPASPFWVDLWQDGLPNSNGKESQGYSDEKSNFKPSIRVYLPRQAKQPVKAVVVCPGGGYAHLALNHEGYDWGAFFNGQGMAAIVLRYRMPNGHREVPLSDAYEAMRYTREHAAEWGIDPACIGIMGSSAGGHLASTVATHAPDELRPAFQILLYPVISMNPELTHAGSRHNLLGDNPSAKLEKELSNDLQVNKKTPPAFIALSEDDRVVKPENSRLYYEALQARNIPAELKVYPTGGHGWGSNLNFEYHPEVMLALKNWLKKL